MNSENLTPQDTPKKTPKRGPSGFRNAIKKLFVAAGLAGALSGTGCDDNTRTIEFEDEEMDRIGDTMHFKYKPAPIEGNDKRMLVECNIMSPENIVKIQVSTDGVSWSDVEYNAGDSDFKTFMSSSNLTVRLFEEDGGYSEEEIGIYNDENDEKVVCDEK